MPGLVQIYGRTGCGPGDSGLLPNKFLPGLSLWLRSDLGISTVSGLVASWADQSPMGNGCSQATAALRPTYNPSGGLKNLPYLVGGAGPVMLSSTTNVVPSDHDRTVWIVMTVGTGNPSGLFEFKLASPYCALYIEDQVSGPAYIYSDGVTLSINQTNKLVNVGESHLLEYDLSTTSNVALYIDGNICTLDHASNMPTEAGGSAGYQVLASYVPFLGNFYEVIVIDHLATVFERALVNAYVQARYGSTL